MRPGKSLSSSRCQGVALVVVLAFLVLLTSMVVAYFSRTMADRQTSNSSFNQAKADSMARSALDIITSDLKQEIVNGSTPLADPNNTLIIYQPTSNAYMVPMRNGVPPPVSGTYPICSTLLRVSSTNAISSPGVDQLASPALSTGTSANGRNITPARWNQHYLMPLLNATQTDTTPVAKFTSYVPCWIYVTGSGGPANPPLATPGPGIIGRYAYAIYDEGALLDVNAAGYPYLSGTTPREFLTKGSVAFADLTQLTGTAGNSLITQAGVNNLVGWRNYASLQPTGTFPTLAFGNMTSGSSYLTMVLSNTTGFTTVSGTAPAFNGRTNQAFLTRQELINFCVSSGTANFNPQALQYLGTFSRTLTGPSWSPWADASDMGGANGTYNTFAYKTNAEQATITNTSGTSQPNPNRNMPNVRFAAGATITHYNDDGSTSTYTVQAGDPLVQRRFSLAKLAWLSATPPPVGGAAAKAIYDCFGLTWDSTTDPQNPCWVYNHGDPNNILTLDEVARGAFGPVREPDFFELLNSAILNGSVGRDPGTCAWDFSKNVPNSDFPGVAGFNFGVDPAHPANGGGYSSYRDLHILQIGANIIDQYDSDGYPTAIYIKKHDPASYPYSFYRCFDTVYGVEDLPYLLRMNEVTFEFIESGTPTPGAGVIGGWVQPEVWNPHQLPAVVPSARPTAFRISAHGEGRMLWHQNSPNTIGTINYEDPVSATNPDARYIYFDEGTTGAAWRDQPLLLTRNNCDRVNTSTLNQFADTFASETMIGTTPANQFVGICSGTVAFNPDTSGTASSISRQITCGICPITYTLEYKDQAGNYRPYSFMARINQFNSNSYGRDAADPGCKWWRFTTWPNFFMMRPDPRTDRFSDSQGSLLEPNKNTNYYTAIKSTLRPNKTTQNSMVNQEAIGWPKGTVFSYNPTYPATFLTPAGWGNFTHYPDSWMQNLPPASLPGNSSSYCDQDSVTRPGDGYRLNLSTGDGCIQFHSASATPAGVGDNQAPRRPLILNRPFRSVGELGYVYRDLPFKTLDFWSKSSGDAGLLDIFSVTDEPPVVAGGINPNNAPAPVLAAILAGTLKEEISSGSSTPMIMNSGTDAKNIGMAVAGYLALNPLRNRSDLVVGTGTTAAGVTTDLSTVINSAFVAAEKAEKANKSFGEAPVRALAPVANTRTWNLIIDVIAQTGGFSANAPSTTAALNSSFMVQGERRYWLHIAIDRFTGQVIDQQLEPVYE